MSKALKTAGAIIGGIALVATGIGAVALAAGTTLGVAGSIAAAGTYALAGVQLSTLTAIGTGLAFLGDATAKPLKVGGVAGSQVDFAADPNAPIPYPIGRTGTGGRIIYATTGEAKNRNILYCTVLGGGAPHNAITGFKANDEEVVFGPLQQAIGGTYANRMWQNRQLGAMPSPAFGPPNTLDPAVLGEWTPAHKLSGYAASWYVLGYDQKTYATGTPKAVWTIEGACVYDPRLDSTFPGGEGDHRIDEPGSWTWSENPWLHALAWSLGRYANGVRVLGIGASPALIDIAAVVENANVADANDWKVGGVVYSNDSKWDVLKAMCQAGGGRPVQLGASITFLVNTPRVSLATLTSDDLVGGYTVQAAQSVRGRPNQIIPKCRSEAHGWEIVACGPVKVAAYVTADRNRLRSREVTYPLVQDPKQVAQLAAYDLVNAREFGPVTVACKPAWMGYRRGDCITVNVPDLGMNGQKALILARTIDPMSGDVSLTLQSETDEKHDFALGRTASPPPVPGLTGRDLTPPAPAVDEWSVAMGLVDDHGSPTLVVTGTCGDPNARWINVEYRLTGEPDWTAWPGGPPNSTRFEITGLAAEATYDVAISYTSVLNLIGDRRVLTATTTGALPTPTAPADTTPPAEPSGLSYTASLGSIFLSWGNPADADLDKVEVWEASANNRATASRVAIVSALPGGASSWSRTGLGAGVTRYYWLRAADQSGNLSGYAPASALAGFAATTASLTIPDFPADLEPVGVGSSLPNPAGYAGPKTFRLSTTGKLYRYVSGAWTAAVPASDITGALDDSQISDLAAAKLTGSITSTQIGTNAVTTAKINAGAVVTAKLAANAVTANEVAAATLTGDRLVAGTISSAYIATSGIAATNLAANSVVAGKVAAGVITGDRLVVDTIETQYLKNNSLANAGIIDVSAHTLVSSTSPGVYTNIGGGGLSFEVRGGGGSYTSILMHLFVEFGNENLVDQVGGWVDVVLSGAGYSGYVMTGGSVLVEPGNPASLSVPLYLRTSAAGTITASIGAFANLTGSPPSKLYANRVKLAVSAIYKS